jgi:hypothetical protein
MKKIKNSIRRFFALTLIIIIVSLLYPLIVCLCIFNPLYGIKLIWKVENALKLLYWLNQIEEV